MRLKDKVAIITGAGSGIGWATSIIFAREGAKVVLNDIVLERIEKLREEIVKNGGEAIVTHGDVGKLRDMQNVAKQAVEAYGRIDILINNAGITHDSLLIKMTEEDWDHVLGTDLRGAFNTIRSVSGTMISQGSGVILSASSISGIYGNIGQANYSAAKAGLIGLTKTLSKELGRKGIRVNAVAPGFIKTPMTAKVPDKYLKMFEQNTPLGRLGEPEDVAYAYLYLASDEARFINGAVLEVTGGLVI